MSWLYTIVFAGLALSSQGSSDSICESPAYVKAATEQAVIADETEKFEQTYPLNPNGRVNVSNVNGSIVVEAWDRNEVKLEYTKIADTKDRLADVEVRIDSKADYFSAETDYGNWRKSGDTWKSGKLTVEFKLTVPRGAMLNEIETVNGSVTVSNFTNFTKVSAVNGSVKATNIRGTARLSTVNGEVAADFGHLETGSKISLDTVNGKVNLVIPSDSNATLKADSLNGAISNDFGLPVRKGKYIGRDLYGKLGSGEVQIKLDSVNGSLSIARQNDGKSLSPAVDLLPQKEKKDDNWDKELNVELGVIDKARINKEITKSVKESHKVSAKAMADAQVALSKIQPEIAKITTESIARSADAITRSAEILSSRNMQRELERAQNAQRAAMIRMADFGFSGVAPTVEKKSGVFVVKGIPKITVDAPGCSVKLRGWDKSEVQYRVTQVADSRRRSPLNIRESHTDTTVDIRVENPDDRGGRTFFNGDSGVHIEISVPRKADLKIKADGELRVEGVTGDVELIGSDEPINVRDVDGKLRVTNSDGLVRVVGFSGEVDSQTDDGEVYLEGDFARITGRAADGNFFLTVPDNANADIKANVEALTVESLRVPTSVTEGHWRFGSGGPRYTFTVADGGVTVRSSSLLTQ